MAFGKYAVGYERRVDYDRLRKERHERAKGQINKGGLGGLIGRHSKIPKELTKKNPFSSWAKKSHLKSTMKSLPSRRREWNEREFSSMTG